MFGYPSFGRFYSNTYRPYSNNFYQTPNTSISSENDKKTENTSKFSNNKDISSICNDEHQNSTHQVNRAGNIALFPVQEKKQNPSQDSDVFNIFGLSLHFDDILIIGLLIFLYTQQADDPYLFMCLIFLLLS